MSWRHGLLNKRRSMLHVACCIALTSFVKSSEIQKLSFHAVWDELVPSRRHVLIGGLHMLVLDEGDPVCRATILSTTQSMLLFRYDATTEQAANMSRLATVLSGLSIDEIKEMLSMTTPPPTEFVVQDDDSQGTSALTHGASTTAASTCSSGCVAGT
jgi:hypothetical protein